jgi:hypothetical protein
MMADVTDTLAQESIAWSLVGENAEAEYEAWLENPDGAEHRDSVLDEVNERDYLKRTYGRIIIDRVVELASKKNPSIRAVGEILDRVLGKPVLDWEALR